MTPGQQRAYDAGWTQFGLEHVDGPLDFATTFGREAETVFEIGYGMGQSLVAMAAAAPGQNFIGVEVHRPGVGKLLHGMAEADVSNIRTYCHDAVEILQDCIADGCLDRVQIFFPDPWHKKRHHKRRLIKPEFVALLRRKLRIGGVLHLATDWENYAEQMMEVLGDAPGYRNACGEGKYSPRPDYRPLTKFEKRGERLGHGVWDQLFEAV